MRFGKTEAEKAMKEQEKIVLKICGIKKFAFFPVRLKDGTYVWMEYYYSYYHGAVAVDGSLYLYGGGYSSSDECGGDWTDAHDNYLDLDFRHINFQQKTKQVDYDRWINEIEIQEDLEIRATGILFRAHGYGKTQTQTAEEHHFAYKRVKQEMLKERNIANVF